MVSASSEFVDLWVVVLKVVGPEVGAVVVAEWSKVYVNVM